MIWKYDWLIFTVSLKPFTYQDKMDPTLIQSKPISHDSYLIISFSTVGSYSPLIPS